MRIHHLNCGCMCPLGGALMDGASRGPTALLVCHCLLIETNRGLVLVDTGFGRRDVEAPNRRFSPLFRAVLGVRLDPRRTALAQVKALGFSPTDVRDIVLTHLDFDHAGGLEDFPEANVHVMRTELDAARRPRGLTARGRYSQPQWDEVKNWHVYDGNGERWFGFEAVRDLNGLPPEILMVPLPGHTWGHAGVAIATPQGWLLHAGDAYMFRHEVDRDERRCPPGVRVLQRIMAVDFGWLRANQDRLRALDRDRRARARIFCSHDAVEFEALAGLEQPA
jgi:glyoxylase-like metal-dependent hydrolase (beta-lactamase superfamily II)